jgi:hypothetical protein
MNDLNDLIGKAKQGLDAEERRAPPEPKQKGADLKTPLALILLLVAIALLGRHFFIGSLTGDMINSDLSLLSERAQQSIMRYYRENDQLPPYIPDPSLRAILRYEVIDALAKPPQFSLQGELNGVSVSRRNGDEGGRQ